MVRKGNQYEERLRSLRLRSAGRCDHLDDLGRLPAGRGQSPEVVPVGQPRPMNVRAVRYI
jgi:hypothetical protein